MYVPNSPERDGDAAARRLRALDRIRKLLRLAEDQAGLPEGQVAREAAQSLMDEHGLHRGSIDLEAGATFRHRSFDLGNKEAWRRTLVHTIADWFDCVALYAGETHAAETFGPEGALPQVEYTFVVYLRQLQLSWRAHVRAMQEEAVWTRLNRRQQVDAREAFCVSFVMGVKERLEAERRKERQEDPQGWVAAERQRRELDRWMRKDGVRWRVHPSGVFAFSDEGFRAGMDAEVRAGLAGRGPRLLTGA